MRNIISIHIHNTDSQNISTSLLCYENLDVTEDTVLLRFYAERMPDSPQVRIVTGGQITLHELTFSSDKTAEFAVSLSAVTRTNNAVLIQYVEYGTLTDQSYSVTFNDFAPATGAVLLNQWQKKMQIYLTWLGWGFWHFEAYLNAAVSIAQNATAGDGLKVDENNELKIDVGDGLEIDEDGKIKVSDPKQVEAIAVTANSSGNVTNVTITYDDESTASYNCTYDADNRLTAFGNVPITWSSSS